MGRRSRTLALCGVESALAVTLLLLGGLLPLNTFCAPLLAMLALLPVLTECGPRAALTAWAAVSLLALMLVADRELALVYVFFGWYPVLRPRIARLPAALLRLLCRLGCFALSASGLYGLLLAVLRPAEILAELRGYPRLLLAALTALGAVTFLLLDRALARLTHLWQHSLRRRLLPRGW